ncbi:pectinesterase inhibitor 5 [Quercus suber]|uniref:pectinesterase inhibitor 5 n=1 Tax=Quercus suber TaxID=58331 RepID=UPI0032DE7D32
MSLFYQVSNAVDEAFLDKICNESADYEFCISTLRSDERTATADPNGLVLISISLNTNLVQTIVNRIPDIVKTLTDPLDITRIQNCRTDYIDIQGKLSTAYTKYYQEMLNLLRDALIKIVERDDEYRLNPPIRESPIADVSLEMQKLIDITFVIVGEIMST